MKHIRKLAKRYYDIEVEAIKRLEGFESDNYLLTGTGKHYILKIYTFSEEKQKLLEGENRLLAYLQLHLPEAFPKAVNNVWGEQLTLSPNHRQIVRVLSYLEGEIWARANITESHHKSLGSFMGKLSAALHQFRDGAIRSRKPHWDLNNTLANYDLLHCITDPDQHKLVHYFLLQFKERVLPIQHRLRQAVIHNDANDWNLLVADDVVVGLIDFGDAAHTMQIAELAVACTYAAMGQTDTLGVCCRIVENYHLEYSLESNELDVLYYLIAARLCMSLCESWYKKYLGEDTPYALVSEQGAADLLSKWVAINPVLAGNAFRKAAGIPESRGNTSGVLMKKRKVLLGDALSVSYEDPIHMSGAAFQYMYEASGTSFLDAYNNIMLVGHGHPVVVESGQRMMARLNTNTRYLYDVLYDYAEHLLEKFPPELSRVFFVNSGSAASDLAIRMARAYTGNKGVAVLEHGYHGNTALGIDISHYKYDHKGGEGKKDFVIELTLPDTYRGKFRDLNDAGKLYSRAASSTLESRTEQLAAFIAEPIVGCGGQVPLPGGYLQEVYEAVRSLGGLCISDEVQVGFGRLGRHFWGFEYHGVQPDVVVLGKPMGNGHPIGAVVTTAEVADRFNNGMEFFSSFGGNPVSCAIGLAVLDVLRIEGLQENAEQSGAYLMNQLIQLASDHEVIGDVRGSGLFVGVDLVRDRATRSPNTALAQVLKNGLRHLEVLTGTDGPADNVMKIKPPLCFSRKNVDTLIDKMNFLLKQNKL